MAHPQKLGKYPVTGILGEGAMGVVYHAHDPVIQRPVAIKTIRKQLIDGNEAGAMMARRFRNEAQAAGRLQHPGVVGVYEYGEDQDVAFIAMEYVEGNSLASYLSRDVRFSDADIRSVMVQLLEALEHAHSHGVWHRDIKPANLIITRQGKLKVADFGIARIDTVGLTQVNTLIGTPSYMAPEQYLGQPPDRRVDIWACGVLLYQLLVGKLPFTGTAEAVMYQVVNAMPVLPSQFSGTTRSAAYDTLIATALNKSPDARYASADRFRLALLEASTEPAPPAVSEETVIMERVRPIAPVPWRGTTAAGGASSAAAAPPTTGSGTPPPGWDERTLSEVESSLARFVGPVARVLVRRAARECTDVGSLKQRLAEHLGTDHERLHFIGREATGQAAAASAARPATGAGGAPATGAGALGGTPLTPETVEQATLLLAGQIGPIARIVARKAASQAATREAFVQQVLAQVPDEADRTRLQAAFAKLR